MRDLRQHKLWPKTNEDFTRVEWNDDFDFAVRIWGGEPFLKDTNALLRPGRVFDPREMKEHLNPKSKNEFYWAKYKAHKPGVIDVMKAITFDDAVWLTSGVPWLEERIAQLYEIQQMRNERLTTKKEPTNNAP